MTGGAGFIGGFTTRQLHARGHDVFVLDDFSSPSTERRATPFASISGDANDEVTLEQALKLVSPDVVVHLMGVHSRVEADADPIRYYRKNAGSVSRLLSACSRSSVDKIVASSTSLVYDSAAAGASLDEMAHKNPVGAYARSKLAMEWMLEDAHAALGVRSFALRYFNVEGAACDSSLGRGPRSTAHLVAAMTRAANGSGEALQIEGEPLDPLRPDFDGTAVRDYVHVEDVALANCLAVERLLAGDPGGPLNVGSGRGHSTLQMLARAEVVFGRPIPYRLVPARRPLVRRLVADGANALARLAWRPTWSLDDILTHAWTWERSVHAQELRAAVLDAPFL